MAEDEAHPAGMFFKAVFAPITAHLHDRAFMTDHFRRHTEEVKAAIAPSRLLIYEAGQGWEPLCAFLGVPAPDTLYPSENTTAEFQARVAARAAGEAT
jgi:hypothetical protein